MLVLVYAGVVCLYPSPVVITLIKSVDITLVDVETARPFAVFTADSKRHSVQ
jgi:hypothetical protein